MAPRTKPIGSGKRKGSLNRKTQAIAKDAIEKGITPLEVMLLVMNKHLKAEQWDGAAAVAKDAAPYIHPRLATVQHSGTPGSPIETRDVTMPELARRIAFIFGQVVEPVPRITMDHEPLDKAT